jgi:4-amino-4-deoxy-L-arabinose transferase-like glycosyltransferase
VSAGEKLLLVLFALVVFLPGIGARDLWNPDEPRYAEVAREMRADGHWLVPHLNGRVYAEKPPLMFWAIAGVSFLTGGVGPAATRLPSVAAAIAAALFVGGIGHRLFERRVGWWAALVFLSGAKILWQGRVGQIDMLLVALVTAAMYFFVRGLVEERPAHYRLFFLFTGLATLAKGPVGLLPPLLAVVAWALVSGERRVLAEMRIPTGLLVWLGVVLAWLVPAIVAGGREYFEVIVLKQNLDRYAHPWGHHQPWHYYLTVIPADFFPWSLFLPVAIWIGWRRLFGPARRGVLLALAWMVVTLVFFSLSPGKRTVYILTMYPAMALLVAAALAEIETTWPRLRPHLTVPALAAVGLALVATLGGFAAVRLAPGRLGERLADLEPMGPGLLPSLFALGILLAAALQVAWLFARRGRVWMLVQTIAAGMGLVAVVAALSVLPRFDAVKSALPLAAELVARSAPEDPWAVWPPPLDATFVFHVRRFAVELGHEDELRAFAARPGPVWLVIEKSRLAELDPPLLLVEVARDAERRHGYVLLTSPPRGEPTSALGPLPGRRRVVEGGQADLLAALGADAVLPQPRVLQEDAECLQAAEHEAVHPIEQAELQEVGAEEPPPGAEDELGQAGAPAVAEGLRRAPFGVVEELREILVEGAESVV